MQLDYTVLLVLPNPLILPFQALCERPTFPSACERSFCENLTMLTFEWGAGGHYAMVLRTRMFPGTAVTRQQGHSHCVALLIR